MTDVLMRQTADGGEVDIANGMVAVTDGLETAVYLSLFGGSDALTSVWWGDLDEAEVTRKTACLTGDLLASVPLAPYNLRRIEDAVNADLAWLVSAGHASSVAVAARVTGVNRVELVIEVVAPSGRQVYSYQYSGRPA